MGLTKGPFQKLYYDKKISIYRTAPAEIRGSQKQGETLIYDKIECSFWGGSKPNFLKSDVSALTDVETYEANLKSTNTNVQRKDLVEVFYVNGGTDVSLGKFIVNSVQFNENYKGELDNIELKLRTQTNGANN